jgi:cytochrome bd-type quinol oxidase subunit 1
MLRMGLYLAAVLVPVQMFFGHLNGEYVVRHQPAKMAAIEARCGATPGRWLDQPGAGCRRFA